MNVRIVFLMLVSLSLIAYEENPTEISIEEEKKEIINWIITTERSYNLSQSSDRELLQVLLDEVTTYQDYCGLNKYRYKYLLDKLAEMRSLIAHLLHDDSSSDSDSDQYY